MHQHAQQQLNRFGSSSSSTITNLQKFILSARYTCTDHTHMHMCTHTHTHTCTYTQRDYNWSPKGMHRESDRSKKVLSYHHTCYHLHWKIGVMVDDQIPQHTHVCLGGCFHAEIFWAWTACIKGWDREIDGTRMRQRE
jgi:hypothetical protein